MRKYFYLATLLVAACFTSCSQDDNEGGYANPEGGVHVSTAKLVQGPTCVEVPDGVENVRIVNWADGVELGIAKVENNHVWINSPYGYTTVLLYDADVASSAKGMRKANGELGYLGEGTVKKSSDDYCTIKNANPVNSGYKAKDFLDIFPGRIDNRGIKLEDIEGATSLTHNAVYISNGLPFSVYPIYSLGWYDLKLGIFYFDIEGNRHDLDFWDMVDVNWKPSYEYLSKNNVKDFSQYEIAKTENAQGYEITLPKNCIFGFYVDCNNDSKAGKYFSSPAQNTCGEAHAVNFVGKDGINYLGFEDQDDGDWDLNDLICYITPTLEIVPDGPTPPVVPPTPVPDEVDKKNHWTTECGLDVEARYTGDGHDYLRLSYPLRSKTKVTLELEKFQQFCEMDDTRIVTHDDIEILYVEDESEKTTMEEKIILINKNTATEYHKVIAELNTEDSDGTYELKVELYPKSEEEYDALIEFINSHNLCDYITEVNGAGPTGLVKAYLRKLDDEYPNDGMTTWHPMRYAAADEALKTAEWEAIAATANGTVLCVVREPFSGDKAIVRMLYVDPEGHIYEYDIENAKWVHAGDYCALD